MADTQVLIVGAGPVGLTMAAFLTHYGIACRIIDQDAHQTLTSNAVCVHARTLELFEEVGLTQNLLDQGAHIKNANFFINKIKAADIDFSYIASPFPFVCDTPQSATETILIEYLQKNNVFVERDMRFISMETNDQGVVAQVIQAGVEKTLSAHWLIACDGYKSTVRQFLAIPYEGAEFEYKFLMIDAPVQGLPSLERGYFASADGLSFFVFPMLHSVRLIVEVSSSKEWCDAQATQETFMAIFKKCLPFDATIDQPLWSSQFYVHERRAQVYRKDRVFLAGDAAHVHIPAAGQGMNTGMQDAINLSWKLALVIKHQASEAILDSYQQERIPIADQVLALTARMAKVMITQNKFIAYLRKLLIKYISPYSWVQKFIVNRIAEVAVQYKNSALNMGDGFHGIHPGMRAPLIPVQALQGKYLILNFSENSATTFSTWPYSDLATIYTVAKDDQGLRTAYAGMESGYCIIRPDRYISYIGNDLQRVVGYFKRIV